MKKTASTFALILTTWLATLAIADVAPIKSAAERAAAAEAAEKAAVAAREARIAAAAAAKAAAKAARENPPAAGGATDDAAGAAKPQEKKIISGSRVTLKGEMSLSDALAELEEQTENRLVDYRGRLDQVRLDPTIELDLDDVSYWAAVEDILDKAELTLYAYTNIPNTMGLAARPENLTANPPVSTSDLFRVQVIRLSSSRDLRDENNQSMVASLEVTWEPRYAPLVIHQAPEDIVATGDDGEELDLNTEYGVGDARVQEGIGAVELDLPFKLPSRSVQKIAKLKGTLRAQIPTEHKKFTFKDLKDAKDIIQREESITVVLESIRKNRDIYELRVMLKLDGAAEELKMQQGWIYANPAYLIDKEGKRIDYAGLETFKATQEEIGLSYKFATKKAVEEYEFVYESPSNIATIPVKYELNGIELP